jgi:DNA-binding MarR family transcriptional regulator
MSESGRSPFGDRVSRATGALSVAADSTSTARLLEAAGWPPALIALSGSPAAAAASIHAFDCQWALPGDTVFADVPSDAGLLCLVSIETIDRIDVLLEGRAAACVFGEDPALIAIALSDLGGMLRAGSAFDSNRAERARLQALAMELARLAEQLGDISTGDEELPDALADRNMAYRAEQPADQGPAVPPDPQVIRQLINRRRLRERFFSPELFADPAWDILLDLAASRLERRSVSVSSLCIAAAVPPTTALRWIRMMTDQQLLERRADPLDARRMFVDLSDAAFDQLCGWFALVGSRGGAVG